MSGSWRRRLTAVLLVTGLAGTLLGCGAGAQRDQTTLTVLAAASLTGAFGDLRGAYQRRHPDTALRFSFAGSQELAAQVRQGAPADVLATADEPTMDRLSRYVRDPHPFATNRLAIAVQDGNPKRIARLADLSGGDVRVVLAGETVPAGRYARKALVRADVSVRPRSEPTDVRQVLTSVRLGEADAGIVYATDIADAGSGEVDAVPIPDGQNVAATYPVAALDDSEHAAQASRFATWLRSAAARKTLDEHGFGSPPKT